MEEKIEICNAANTAVSQGYRIHASDNVFEGVALVLGKLVGIQYDSNLSPPFNVFFLNDGSPITASKVVVVDTKTLYAPAGSTEAE